VKNLRAQIAADPALARLDALLQKEQRLQAINRQLIPLQTEALALQAEIAALRASA
jgi:hypothetical protein